MQNSTTTCTYSLPVNYLNATPTLPTHDFRFRREVCTVETNVPLPVSFSGTTSSGAIGFNPTTTISTSSNIQVYGYMSSGEVLISALLIMLIFVTLLQGMAQFISSFKFKRTVMKYEKSEVPLEDVD